VSISTLTATDAVEYGYRVSESSKPAASAWWTASKSRPVTPLDPRGQDAYLSPRMPRTTSRTRWASATITSAHWQYSRADDHGFLISRRPLL
jgi:hypothetical protein